MFLLQYATMKEGRQKIDFSPEKKSDDARMYKFNICGAVCEQ